MNGIFVIWVVWTLIFVVERLEYWRDIIFLGAAKEPIFNSILGSAAYLMGSLCIFLPVIVS